jgi:hypothetical protein
MDKPWKVITAFVGVFIAGAVFGGVFTLRASGKRLAAELPSIPPAGQQPDGVSQRAAQPPGQLVIQPRGNPITPTLMRQFTRRLNLSAEQKDRIAPVVSRAGEDLLRLRQEHFADTQRVTERMYADVSAALSPEQRVELEAMRRELQERLQAERQKSERPKKTDTAPEGANRVAPDVPARSKVTRPPGG